MATTTNLGKVVITPRGAYSPSTAYVALDIIEYNGSGYLVLAPATGVTPPNATYYMLLAAKGATGSTGQAATVTVGTVGSLPAGSTPTVTNTGTANNAIFNFGLTQGNNWYTGNAITGTSATPTAYATGITLAGVGDLYLNPSITANQGNVYRCTIGGNAATARWIYVGNIAGTLSGAVAYTAQTPTSGQQIQARANINAASTTHASTHATGQSDALALTSIAAAGVDYADSTTVSMITNGGVFTGGAVTAQGTPGQTVAVSAGSIVTPKGKRYAFSLVSALAATAADATNPRIDIVYVTSAGVVTYLAGTAAASPAQPSTPANGTVLAAIARAATDNTIATADITDQRDFITVASDFEDVVPVTESSNAFSCDFAKKHTKNFSFPITNTTGKTVTFTNVPYGTCDTILTIKATGTASVTWTLDGRALVWPNGAPTLTTAFTYIILISYSVPLGKWMGFAQTGAAN